MKQNDVRQFVDTYESPQHRAQRFDHDLLLTDQVLGILLKLLAAFVIITGVNAYVMWSYWPVILQLLSWLAPR